MKVAEAAAGARRKRRDFMIAFCFNFLYVSFLVEVHTTQLPLVPVAWLGRSDGRHRQSSKLDS